MKHLSIFVLFLVFASNAYGFSFNTDAPEPELRNENAMSLSIAANDSALFAEPFDSAGTVNGWNTAADASSRPEDITLEWASDAGVGASGALRYGATNGDPSAGRAYILEKIFSGVDFQGNTDVTVSVSVKAEALSGGNVTVLTDINGSVVEIPSLNPQLSETEFVTFTFDHTAISETANSVKFLLNIATGPVENQGATILMDDIQVTANTGGSGGGGGSSDNLLTNGDFEGGDDGSWSGNALNIVTENGNSFNFADVETAGNPFDVNLSQVLNLTGDKVYELSFTASTSDGNERTMVAGIGLNVDPFTAATETVTLTPGDSTYVLTLTATGIGGPDSRVLFDMGADTGIVVIDNVVLVESTGDSDELLTNGDFESGDDGSWIGNAFNILTDGGNSFNFADVETAGNAFDVNLSQVVPITPGESYTFSFEAGSSGNGRTLVVGIGLNEAPFSANVETITLTDSLMTYTLELDAIDDGTSAPFGNASSRVLFDMGADTGVVVIDNVSLKVGSGGGGGGGMLNPPDVAAPTPPARDAADVISIFSDAYTDINVETFSAGFDDSDVEDVQIDGNATKKISFGNFIGVEFVNDRQDLTGMTHFHIDFWTSKENLDGAVFIPKLSNWAGGSGEANALELTITTGSDPAIVSGSWVSVDVRLDDFTGINGSGREDIAQFLITSNLGEVFVDNIYFYSEGGGGGSTGEELLANGDFEAGSADPWFVNFGDGVPLQTDGGNTFFFADVETAGDAFAVNLSQVVPITQGELYTLSFTASSAGNGRTMIAGIGLNEAPFNAATETVELTQGDSTYVIELTAADFGIPNSRVLFDMGADTGVVVIDNVSLIEGEGTSNEEVEASIPTEVTLNQNYPNPFNPTTNISFNIPQSSNVTLEVFNITGQRVMTLVDGFRPAGEHLVTFDATNLASGIYIYRMIAGNSVQVRKMMLIK